MLGALQTIVLRHSIKRGAVLKHEVVDELNLVDVDLVLHNMCKELHQLEPRPPRRGGSHRWGEKRVDDVETVK